MTDEQAAAHPEVEELHEGAILVLAENAELPEQLRSSPIVMPASTLPRAKNTY